MMRQIKPITAEGKSLFTNVVVRAAAYDDVLGILEIYNEAVLNTTASYDYEPSTPEARLEWFDAHHSHNLPIFVAQADDDQVVGWSSLSEFRPRIGYRYTGEDSVYVRPAYRGHGIGKMLLSPLIMTGRELGFHAIIAAIDADNTASLRLHELLGFERVAYLRQVGFKFDRWLDLVYMELLL